VFGWVIFFALGFMTLFANVVTTRRLWASASFETSQKVAQTALIWLVPGGAIVVWNFLREPRVDSHSDPSTGGVSLVVAGWLLGSPEESSHHASDAGHHGSDGGHHSHGDGGGHHGGDGGHGGGFDGGGGGHF